jgi:enoyl-CoA hydratase/carnithine racemase
MAGQQVDARRALEMGIVQAVSPADEFDARVREFVDTLCTLPSEAMALAKLTIKLVQRDR